jgi:hypothetical protein
MLISELIEQLETAKAENGDIHVLYTNANTGDPYPVGRISVEVAEKDQYPDDYEMPEGFTFVNLGSW